MYPVTVTQNGEQHTTTPLRVSFGRVSKNRFDYLVQIMSIFFLFIDQTGSLERTTRLRD